MHFFSSNSYFVYRRTVDREESDDFLKAYNGLNHIERTTSKKMDSLVLEVKGKRSKSYEDVRRSGSYVPRNQKFNHMLDTAYDDILVKKAREKNRGLSGGTHQLYESFRPVDFYSSKSSMTSEPSVSVKVPLLRYFMSKVMVRTIILIEWHVIIISEKK